MSVTVDDRELAVDSLGLQTLGQVLSHLQRDSNRLVVQVLIDGQEPDLDHLASVRQEAINGRTVYIETVDPVEMALEVLSDVEQHLDDADADRTAAVDLFTANQPNKALERLGRCFTTWQHAHESVIKVAQLLRLDLGQIEVNGRPLPEMLQQFTQLLRDIRSSLEGRDYVVLSDILTYEAAETTAGWLSALTVLRAELVK